MKWKTHETCVTKDKDLDKIYGNGLGLCRMDKNLTLYYTVANGSQCQ